VHNNFQFFSLLSAVLSAPSTPAMAENGARTSLDQQHVAGPQMQTINAYLEH